LWSYLQASPTPSPTQKYSVDLQRSPNVALQRSKSGHTGALAHLVEHLLCKQGVVGSIPTSSTMTMKECSAHKI
jgi:hypothetical protein